MSFEEISVNFSDVFTIKYWSKYCPKLLPKFVFIIIHLGSPFTKVSCYWYSIRGCITFWSTSLATYWTNSQHIIKIFFAVDIKYRYCYYYWYGNHTNSFVVDCFIFISWSKQISIFTSSNCLSQFFLKYYFGC